MQLLKATFLSFLFLVLMQVEKPAHAALAVGVTENQNVDGSPGVGVQGGIIFNLQKAQSFSCGSLSCFWNGSYLALVGGLPKFRLWTELHLPSIYLGYSNFFITPLSFSGMVTRGNPLEAVLGGDAIPGYGDYGNSHALFSTRVGYALFRRHIDFQVFVGPEGGYVRDLEAGAGFFGVLVGGKSTLRFPFAGNQQIDIGVSVNGHINVLPNTLANDFVSHGVSGMANLTYLYRLGSGYIGVGPVALVQYFNVIKDVNNPLGGTDQANGLSLFAGLQVGYKF